MASLKYDAATKAALIQWRDSQRQRRTIRLSKVSKSFAERVHSLAERLNDAQRTGSGFNQHDATFIQGLADIYYDKFVAVGLIEPRADRPSAADDTAKTTQTTLGPFLIDYLARRTDLKGTSLSVYEQVQRNLLKHFGPEKLLTEISQGDAIDFGRFLHTEKLSRTTIDRRMRLASTILNDAVRHEYIAKNPFHDWRKPLKNLISRTNKSRQRFITREDFAALIEHAPDAECRLLIALARFGGLRTPSEPLSIKWGDVDWAQGRIKVPSPKTEHHEGREFRIIPIFGEIRPFLEECFDAAEPGAEWIIAKHRPASVRNGDGWKHANLRTMLTRIYRRAGLPLPPKPWNNMRASRSTELAEEYPGHVAAAWLGHTEEIAVSYYRQVLPEHYSKAIQPCSALPQALPLGAVLKPQGLATQTDAPEKSGYNAAKCDLVRIDARVPAGADGNRTHLAFFRGRHRI